MDESIARVCVDRALAARVNMQIYEPETFNARPAAERN
jgi:hypothetical protein